MTLSLRTSIAKQHWVVDYGWNRRLGVIADIRRDGGHASGMTSTAKVRLAVLSSAAVGSVAGVEETSYDGLANSTGCVALSLSKWTWRTIVFE